MTQSGQQTRLFSIGHSNHGLETFLGLLRQHGIEVLVDVRSQPASRYASQFDRGNLQEAAAQAGIKYLFLGRELGGRPPGDAYYDAEGHVRYDQVAEAPFFLEGVERLEQGAPRYRVALMCSEENPAECHRHLLVERVLAKRGIVMEHIRGDGRIQSAAELEAEERGPNTENQLALFAEAVETPWRSVRAIRKPERSSAS